ncbi:MAG TPA: hypothetical protein PLU44_16840 [Candidatus Krumholzibacteria bacterium]|nr:hypothetical protein [Candidatus Krumholzibacteria bacterium]
MGLRMQLVTILKAAGEKPDAERVADSLMATFAEDKDGVWVEVCLPGTWNASVGGEVTIREDDLTGIATAFDELRDTIKVPVRIGGHEGLMPAGGWVSRMRNTGGRLMAMLTDVPPVVREAINKRLFKQVSVGLRRNWKDPSGKVRPWVADHLAILGGRLPAVKGLQDLPALFGDQVDGLVLTFDNKEYVDMDEKALKDRIEALEKQVKTLTEAGEKAAKDHVTALAAKDTELKAAQTKLAEHDAARAKAEIEGLCEAAVKDGRLLPASKDAAVAAGLALRQMANFAEQKSPFAIWAEDLKSRPKILKFEEKAEASGETKPDPSDKRTPEQKQFDADFAEGAKLNEPDKKKS